MAWTNLTFNFGAILTSSQMTQLDDNLDALAAGSAGAPKVLDAALNSTFVKTTGNENIAGVKTFTGNRVTVSGSTPTVFLSDTDANADDFFLSANLNIFHVTTDRDGDGSAETPHPLRLDNAGAIGKVYDREIYSVAGKDVLVTDGGTNASTASGARTNLGLGAVAVLDKVDQGALKTTTGTVSTTSDTLINLTLPGGSYGFYPQVKGNDAGTNREILAQISIYDNTATPTVFVTNIALANEFSGNPSTAQQRYIQASPPYDLGNGDISLFIFAVIDNITGNIISTYVAEDPPWANNGPTNIRPDRVAKDGKKYQNQILLPDGSRVSQGSPGFNALIKSKLGVQAIRDQWIDALRNPTITEIEITQDIKQADMGIIPHPFGSPQPGKTIVLLDPVGSVVDDLYLLKEQGADITDIVMNHISIGNTPNGANSPPGVMSVSTTWRNTL